MFCNNSPKLLLTFPCVNTCHCAKVTGCNIEWHTGEKSAIYHHTISLQVFIASHCLPLHHLRMARSQSVLALLSPSPVLPVKSQVRDGETRMD